MRRTTGSRWAARVASSMLAGALVAPLAMSGAHAQTELPEQDEEFSALVFSKTASFRHQNIETGVAAIEDLGDEYGFSVDHTEDGADFNAENLAQYDVVVWLSTTGDVLNNTQQAAFEQYIQNGGGYAGIHAASDTEYGWEWYGDLVGAYFASHPPGTPAGTVVVEDPAHPSTEHLPARWDRVDEWYSFRSNPRGDVHVLASLDESTYNAGSGAMGDHPIAWCHNYDGGRSWYTGGGHTHESFAEDAFLQHVLEGIRTAAGVIPSDCDATLDESFDKVALDLNTQNPMDLAPTPDGRTIYLERDGRVQIVAPTGGTTTAGTLSVTQVQEFGLVGLELDPDFADNGWIYLYYSPTGSDSDRVSRFTLEGDTLDMASEQILLEVEVQRDECCHAGGALEFDGQGNLYIATGDNTNPFASGGYSPIDERPGRSAWDAQATSANTNDLRGKILRITPQDDGTYTIPEGNLFAEGTDLTRPEIFGMGFRNPFKIGMDPRNDVLLVADYGPDAGSANPNRGPAGIVEWNIVDEPGNYGWPHCVGNNLAYNRWDFASNTGGEAFDCESGPQNTSPHNTGLTDLPAAIEAAVWYQNSGATGNAPEIGNGGAPMAGGVYVYDEELASDRKWPAYFDGKAAFAEWNTGRMYSFQMSDDGTELVDINRILSSMSFARPHALEWGADGALYIIEWGSGFGGNNADSGIYRLDYVSGFRAPVVRADADVTNGPLPLEVQFSSEGSRDPDGGTLSYAWDFGDGTTSTAANPQHTYTEAGNYTATLTVTTANDQTATATVPISAGNTAPTIEVDLPPNGGFFNFGDVVEYSVTVTDPEDGEIDCERVIVQPALGHDEHAHPYGQHFGCEGAVAIPGDTGHIGANIFGVLTVTYTDEGAEGVAPLTTQEIIILQPKQKEAEYFAETGRLPGSTSSGDAGVEVEETEDVGGGQNIGFAEVDDWFSFDPTNLTGIDAIRVRGASEPGGTVDIRTGAPDGPSIGSVTIPAGGWQSWGNYDLDLPEDVTTETGALYFVITAGQANINWVEFIGQGVTDNASPSLEATASETTGPAPLTVFFTATATDPDGDTPLTYEWDFGDGETADTAEVAHTYTAAGSYTATVTVTDARGASSFESFEISVSSQSTKCFSGRSDDFVGDELDSDRWNRSIGINQDLRVEDGHVVIPTVSRDIYGTDNSGVPNLVLQDLPAGPFTATTKVTMPGSTAYQQAGLIIYGDDDNYAKMVLSGRSTGGPDPASRVFQLIREENAQPNEVGASLTPAVGADYPETVWVRFTSDGENLVASYSADGVEFTDMPEVKSLAGIENPKIGLLSLQGNGRTQAPVDAAFDNFTITPDDSVESADPNDEFDGNALDGCRWDVVRPDSDHLRVRDGKLELDATTGDIYGTDNGAPANFVLQELEGDWTVETLVDASALTRQYEQGGLIVYVDDDNYVKFDVAARNTPGANLQLGLEVLSEVNGVIQNPQPAASVQQAVWHLRVEKAGDQFISSYSADGTEWTTLEAVSNAPAAAAGRVGLFALGTSSEDDQTVTFDYFRVVGDEVEPPADTEAPTVNGNVLGTSTGEFGPTGRGDLTVGGTATLVKSASGTSLSVRATGLVFGDEYPAHLHDGSCADHGGHYMHDHSGPMAPPNEIWASSSSNPEGDLVPGRNGIAIGNGSADWIARQQPLSIMIHEAQFPGLPIACAEFAAYDAPAELVASADDGEGSGVDTVEYRLNGGDWTVIDGSVEVDEPGEHTAEFRATDVEGNVSDIHEVTFAVAADEPAPEPVEVTPAAVSFDDQDGTANDTFTVPSVEGVEYRVGNRVFEAGTYPGSDTVTVTARALDGYVLADGADTEWSFTFSAEGGQPDPVEVTPAAVTFDDQDGTEDDSYTVPAVEGVEYLIDGDVVEAGTYDGAGTVTVTARALDGYVLADGADTEWSFTFSTEGGEPGPQPPSSVAEFHLSNDWVGTTHHFFKYGRITDEVFVGDWDGNGTDTIALRRGNTFYVSNAPRGGEADWVFQYGRDGDVVLVGDWDGDGRDTFAVRRGSEYHVSNSLSGGAADAVVTYGRAGDVVLVGDWDGDGVDTLAVRRGAVYHVRNSLSGGPADTAVQFGRVNDEVFVGDWDGNGTDTLGIRRGQRPGEPAFLVGRASAV